MKRHHFAIILITVMLSLGLSSPVMADSFASTIEIYKKDASVQPFFKNAYGFAVIKIIP